MISARMVLTRQNYKEEISPTREAMIFARCETNIKLNRRIAADPRLNLQKVHNHRLVAVSLVRQKEKETVDVETANRPNIGG